MGEWSEYFEDFPEENPANQISPAEKRLNVLKEKVVRESRELQDEMFRMRDQARADAAKKSG